MTRQIDPRGHTPNHVLFLKPLINLIRGQFPRDQRNRQARRAVGPLTGLVDIRQRRIDRIRNPDQAVFSRHGLIGKCPSGDRAVCAAG